MAFVHIDTQNRILSRYESGKLTHKIVWGERDELTSMDVEKFRVSPESFLNDDADGDLNSPEAA